MLTYYPGMHRKSMEVAQHYTDAEGKLTDAAITSGGSMAARGSDEEKGSRARQEARRFPWGEGCRGEE